MRRITIVIALATLTGTLTACQLPRFEGAEIQSPPANFQRQADNFPQRRVFPDLSVSHHAGWVHTDMDGVSIIYIDGHPGTLTMEAIMVAREEAQAAESDPDAVYGSLETLTIDGRRAWGWYRTIQSPSRGLEEVTYTAVVPYDTISYALQFTSTEATLKRASPDTLRAIVTSFAIGRTTYNVPLIALLLGAMLFATATFRTKRKEREARLRSINLVTIKKDEEKKEADEGKATAAAGAGMSTATAAPPADALHPQGPTPRAGPVPPPLPDPDPRDPSAGS